MRSRATCGAESLFSEKEEGGFMVKRTRRNLRKSATLLIVVIAGLALASGLVFGQEFSATMSGVVHDASGGLVPGVSVTAKHTESGLTRTAITNETGSYRLPSLPVGAYEVTAELSGFKQQVRRGVNLVVTQEAVVNFTLEVGDINDNVTVTEDAPLVNDAKFYLRPGHPGTSQKSAVEWTEFPGTDDAQRGRDYEPIEYDRQRRAIVLDRGQAARQQPLYDERNGLRWKQCRRNLHRAPGH